MTFTHSLNPKQIIFHSTQAGSIFRGTETHSKLSTYAQATTNHMHHIVSNKISVSSKCMPKDKYSKSWYIEQLWDQRFAKYYSFSDIRMLYQMCAL